MGFGDTFKFYAYTSDDGNVYSVKLSALVAAEGGFTVVSGAAIKNGYPFGPKNMRHVWGVSAAGKRARVPMADASDPKFVTGGTFSLHGASYTIEGAIGEARKLSFLGG